MIRVLTASIVGGIVVFLWGAISHMVLGLGEKGMSMEKLPGEQAILTTLSENIPETGIYFVPGMDPTITDSQRQWDDAMERMNKGPVAFMVVTREGYEGNMAMQMVWEAVSSAAAALIVSIVLLAMRGPYLFRVLVVAGFGVFAWLSYGASEVIWYDFPEAYGVAQLIDQFVGWALAGLFMAAIVRSRCASA